MDSCGSAGAPERVRSAWERCAARGMSRDLDGPREVLPDHEVEHQRALSPLGAHVDVVADLLGVARDAAGTRVAVLTGPDGTVLWRRGGRSPLGRADRLGFVEGAGWDEHGVGTNAIAQALRSGAAEELRGTEHFARSHSAWDCTSAPVRHPGSGEVLGVIDLSGPRGTATPDTRALVRSAARVVETLLAAHTASRHPAGTTGTPSLELRLLAEPAAARVGGGDWFPLPTRSAEILALLSLRERDFILASEGLGAGKLWVISRHFIKNVLSSVLVASTNSIASAILTESSLSYLGFGITIPNASWGGMLEGAQTYILTHPMLAVYPGACILITVLSFNVLGNAIRRSYGSGR